MSQFIQLNSARTECRCVSSCPPSPPRIVDSSRSVLGSIGWFLRFPHSTPSTRRLSAPESHPTAQFSSRDLRAEHFLPTGISTSTAIRTFASKLNPGVAQFSTPDS